MRSFLAVVLLASLLAVGGARAESARRCTISGTPVADVLVGTSHKDVICGLGGPDVIRAGKGADIVYGGRGNDVVYGGPGKDRLYGDSGSDTFFTVDGARDFIHGGPDFDRARIDRDRARSVEGYFRREAYPLLLAAGDIASCQNRGDDGTAVLLDAYPQATVATLGDNAYESGSAADFAQCYGPTWGRAKARTRPALGDHEYRIPGAAGYFDYFGAAAGERGKGYYSYDIGTWHVVVLNANCSEIGGCSPNAPETVWLRADLASHPRSCTLAYWDRPRFSSGTQGGRLRVQPFWEALYAAGAEVVLSADDHLYERFAPQTPSGSPDAAHGIREFVVGTGGKSFSPFGPIQPQSEAHENDTFGVLKLSLRPAGYAWSFIPVAGRMFTDRGSGSCR